MPVVREQVSISVFCEEMGIDPKRFVGVEVNRKASTVTLVLEPEDFDGSNTGGTTGDVSPIFQAVEVQQP